MSRPPERTLYQRGNRKAKGRDGAAATAYCLTPGAFRWYLTPMRRTVLALAAALAASAAAARPAPAAPPPADTPMSVDEVRALLKARRAAGQPLTGFGKTVFQGTAIERFDVEIVDILPNFMPKIDIILARCRHPQLEQSGVIAGMSGSPVYLEGKVIGAVAYGWTFSKEALAGITPIHAMLAELDRPREKQARALPPSRPEAGPVQRVRTPLLAAGLGARALSALEADLAPWGFLPLQAGGGGADDGGVELEAGGAVGVQLLSGDADLTAVGTVTWRDGDKVLAFGHPFFNAGEIALPVTTAVVHAVMPSLARPFKLASPGREVGALVQDRTSCVAGRIGPVVPRVPLEVTVRSAGGQSPVTYRYRVVHHDLLTPSLVRSAVFGAVDAYEPGMELNTVTAETTIRLKGIGPVTVRNTFANQGQSFHPGMLAAFDTLFNNPFERPVVEGVVIDLFIRHEERVADIKNAWLAQAEVEAGGTARLDVVLRVRHGRDEVRRVEVPVPAGLAGRELTIRVTGGNGADPEPPPPTSLRELAAALPSPYESTQLVVSMPLPTVDLRYRGRVLDRIPNSILGPLVPGLEDRALLTATPRRVVVPTDWVILGADEVKVRVK